MRDDLRATDSLSKKCRRSRPIPRPVATQFVLCGAVPAERRSRCLRSDFGPPAWFKEQ